MKDLSRFPFTLVLASKSPRRREIMEKMQIPFVLYTKDTEEHYPGHMPFREVPEFLALKKAEDVIHEVGNDKVVLAADTIVLLENRIYGKPEDAADAKRILSELSGKMHEVITGVCLLSGTKKVCFSETTRVFFKELSAEAIEYYVESYHPLDKAGAYAIQEWIGMAGISRIEGDYYNIVGLPIQRVYDELCRF